MSKYPADVLEAVARVADSADSADWAEIDKSALYGYDNNRKEISLHRAALILDATPILALVGACKSAQEAIGKNGEKYPVTSSLLSEALAAWGTE